MQNIKLERSTNDCPWGFRLIGGVDFGTPITVCKVEEDSLAFKSDLKFQDKILKINDRDVYGLTHAEVHSLIIKSENSLILEICRDGDDKKTLPIIEKDFLSEIKKKIETEEKIPKIHININFANDNTDGNFATVSSIEYPLENMGFETISTTIPNSNRKSLKELSNEAAVQSRQKKFLNSTKKWSTFLQKPNWPIPKPKIQTFTGNNSENKAELDSIPFEDSLKTKISDSKQTYDEIQLDSNEMSNCDCIANELNNSNARDDAVKDVNDNVCELSDIINEETNCDNNDENNNLENDVFYTFQLPNSNNKENTNENVNDDTNGNDDAEEDLDKIEERLKDLLQLPKTFELLITSLTSEMFGILDYLKKVKIKQSIVNNNNDDDDEEYYVDDDVDENKKKKKNIIENDVNLEQIQDSIVNNGRENNANTNKMNKQENSVAFEDFEIIEIGQFSNGNDSCRILKIIDTHEIAIDRPRNETDERVGNESFEIGFETNKLSGSSNSGGGTGGPLMPLERPIILPGGIKWRKPIDAYPQVDPNCLSDDLISETLSSQSELLNGNVVGNNWTKTWPWLGNKKPIYRINFKKFNAVLPSIQNCDHIQQFSEVYKMIQQEYDDNRTELLPEQ